MNTPADRHRKLPIGIQSFKFLRSEGYLYIDKTALIYRLVTEGKPYFLSRPPALREKPLALYVRSLLQGEERIVPRAAHRTAGAGVVGISRAAPKSECREIRQQRTAGKDA